MHRRTLDRSYQHAVFPADGRFVLQATKIIVFWCHRSNDQPSVVVLNSRLLAQRPGTTCQKIYTKHLPGLNTPLYALSAQNVTFQEVFSGHHHLIVTASCLLA